MKAPREKCPCCGSLVRPRPDASTFGGRLETLRSRRGFSMADVEARTGITRGVQSRYEHNTSEIGSRNLMKLAALYEVTTDTLLYGPLPNEG